MNTVKVYLIMNDSVTEAEIPQDTIQFENGLKYFVDDYGMGSCWWPIIESPKDAYQRQLTENVVWAARRLIWAKKQSKKEIPDLEEVINSGGKSRLQSYLNKFKSISE